MAFRDAILDSIFPSRCAGCSITLTSPKTVCDACFAAIPLHAATFCAECGARVPSQNPICHRSAPYRLGAATDYENKLVRALIHDLKFKWVRNAALPLGELLAAYAARAGLRLEGMVVVPVPLGTVRERQRGFNQAALIAAPFAVRFGIAAAEGVIARVRETKPQSDTQSRNERKENIAGCFRVARAEPIAGKRVILVDDVTTSGATFREAATALKRSGARSVLALAVAKT